LAGLQQNQIGGQFGNARPEMVDEQEEIELSQFDPQEDDSGSTDHIAEIVEARLDSTDPTVATAPRSSGSSSSVRASMLLTARCVGS